ADSSIALCPPPADSSYADRAMGRSASTPALSASARSASSVADSIQYPNSVRQRRPRFQMMAPVVANEVLNQNNWPFGAALSFMLMIVTLLLTVIANVVVARRYSH